MRLVRFHSSVCNEIASASSCQNALEVVHNTGAVLQLLKTMGCVDPTNHSDAHLPAGCLAACMVAAGIRPEEDALLKSLVAAYRGYALKNIVVRAPQPPCWFHRVCLLSYALKECCNIAVRIVLRAYLGGELIELARGRCGAAGEVPAAGEGRRGAHGRV